MYFLFGLRKNNTGKKPAKNVPLSSIKNIRSLTLSRENAIFATSITPSGKSNYSYKLISKMLGLLEANFSDLILDFLL